MEHSSIVTSDLSLSPSLSIIDNMHNDTPQPQYLKLEDLQSASSPAPSSFDAPASVIIHSRPAKKRKSWGQELPEPKTALPPRKRAKTDDEKEQRRIERIKRNRAAAHNSRERKRQETENLAVLLARARAEIDAYRRLHGPLPADVVLPEVTLNKDPESPKASECFPSPATSMIESVKAEPTDTITPLSLFEDAASSPLAIPSLDTTQHSAVSVEPHRDCEEIKPEANLEQVFFELPNFSSATTTALDHQVVDKAVSVSYPSPHSECLPSDARGSLDSLVFTDAGFDQPIIDDSFGNDAFFFDDLIDTDAVAAFAIEPAIGAA